MRIVSTSYISLIDKCMNECVPLWEEENNEASIVSSVDDYLMLALLKTFCFVLYKNVHKNKSEIGENKISNSERKRSNSIRDRVKFFQEGKKEEVRQRSVMYTGAKESVKSKINRIDNMNSKTPKEAEENKSNKSIKSKE